MIGQPEEPFKIREFDPPDGRGNHISSNLQHIRKNTPRHNDPINALDELTSLALPPVSPIHPVLYSNKGYQRIHFVNDLDLGTANTGHSDQLDSRLLKPKHFESKISA